MGYIGAGLTRFNTADQLTVSGDAEFQGNANLGDNDKILLGTGDDLQVWHSGANSFVVEEGTGSLFLGSNGASVTVSKGAGGETMGKFIPDGAVELYHNNAKKIETTSTGVDVTGTLVTDGITSQNSTAPTLNNDTHAGEALFLKSGGTGGDGNVQAVMAFGKADGSANRSGSAIGSIQTDTDVDKIGIAFYTSDSSASSQTMDERFRIDHVGNVGIGCSPTSKFQVQGATTSNNIEIGGNYIQSFNRGATPGYQSLPIYASQFTFFTGGTERLRVDSSGRVLVGGTSTAPGFGNTSTGLNLSNDGRFFASVSGETHSLNRNTSDGDILQFRKDGATVGSIASATKASDTNIYIGSTDTNLYFFDDVDAITACNSSGSDRDNAVDLGRSGVRFKDLYLGGGLYVGGTGSANHLDDYEEGTWTPSLAFATGSTGITYTHQNAADYIKIGKFVFVRGGFRINSKGTSTGAARVAGLPFTIKSIGYGDTTAPVAMGDGASGLTSNVIGVGGNDSTNLYLYDSGSTGLTTITDSNFGTNTYVLFSFCYNIA